MILSWIAGSVFTFLYLANELSDSKWPRREMQRSREDLGVTCLPSPRSGQAWSSSAFFRTVYITFWPFSIAHMSAKAGKTIQKIACTVYILSLIHHSPINKTTNHTEMKWTCHIIVIHQRKVLGVIHYAISWMNITILSDVNIIYISCNICQ